MKQVLIVESMGGVDPQTGEIFQYQKGEIVVLSDVRFKGIRGHCKIIDPLYSETLKNLDKAENTIETSRNEVLDKIENRVDKTVTRRRKRK